MIQVLLADDHELVRTGLRRLLDDVDDITVVAEATSGEEALRLCREVRPNVVLMDINMPGMGGIEATRKICQFDANIKIIVVTMAEDEVLAQSLLKAGAAGYLTKGCRVGEIVHAVMEVTSHRFYITPQIATQLAMVSTRSGQTRSPFHDLSERELQVMMMTLAGRKTQEISDNLCLSPKTVSTYRHRLFNKLGIQTDIELAHLAMKHGLTQNAL